MGIFDKLFKSKESCCDINVQKSSCSCDENHESFAEDTIEIRILGLCCKNYDTLEENILHAVNELGFKAKVKHITDFTEVATYGIISTPGLWIDGKIVSYGKVLSKDEIKDILKKIV